MNIPVSPIELVPHSNSIAFAINGDLWLEHAAIAVANQRLRAPTSRVGRIAVGIEQCSGIVNLAT